MKSMNNQKGTTSLLIVVLIGLTVGGYLVFTNYSNNRIKLAPIQNSQTLQPTPTPFFNASVSPSPKPQNLIEFGKIEVGDVLSGLKVKSITPVNKDLGMSAKNFRVTFSGKTTISGKYIIDDKKDYFKETYVYFEPDTSTAQLPYVNRLIIFFSDQEKAIEKLSAYGKSGNITIEIDNYSTYTYPSEGFSGKADLVRIVK